MRWLKESREYSNRIRRTFREDYFRRLDEDKSRFIDRNDNLDDEQKEEIKDFFARHPNYENRIDWNRKNLEYKDFEGLLSSEGKSRTQAKKKGLGGLVEGKDYVVIERTPDFIAYQPLTYLGSMTIASNRVPPVKEAGAQWCTAYQKTSHYWDSYSQEGIKFIYVCTKDDKYALVLYPESLGGKKGCFSFEDESIECPEYLEYLYDKELKDYPSFDINLYIDRGLLVKEPDGRYSCYDRVKCLGIKIKNLIKDGRFVIRMNKWAGNFNCYNSGLVSLEGAPQEVGGNFNCGHNDLDSLKGGPLKVGGGFYCNYNGLVSLEGAPKEVGEDFFCQDNDLDSLELSPEIVGGDFDCDRNCLTSLEGISQNIGGGITCQDNILCTLKGSPRKVEYLDCSDNMLTSLEGAPREISQAFNCSNNRLETLEGCPEYIGVFLLCSGNPLPSDIEKPSGVKGRFIFQ